MSVEQAADAAGKDHADALNRHYAPQSVWDRIESALRAAGLDPAQLSRDDAARFDEFHGGGRESTRALARFADLVPGTKVIDIGCGIGGPARTLCAEFSCTVTGVDLTLEFIRAAERLSAAVGMDGQVEFLHGSALALPCADASADVVWSQNMLMNIEDKAGLAREVHRVLRSGGRFAFEAVVAGTGAAVYPCFWAETPALSFLLTREALCSVLSSAGLRLVRWEDNTPQVVALGRKRLASLERGSPSLGIGVLVPELVLEKTRNALRNNEEGRTHAVQAIFEREK